MAIKIPIITELQDEGIKKAKREFDKFKGAVAGAQGTMGKLKAGSKVAFDAIGANAGTMAVAAGTAFAKFAFDSAKAFTDLATAAGKFSDATGVAVEDASRWMEVAGDIGIETKTVETAIGKMNKELGKSPELFEEFGIQVAYANDGSVDANETFLNTIDRLKNIKDPALKARIAAQLLGRGWQDVAELVQMGSDRLRESLGDVSDAKVIDPKELEKAKKFRATMDEFADTLDDIKLTLGESVIPFLQDMSDLLMGFKDFNLGKISSGLFGIVKQFQIVDDLFKGFGKVGKSGWNWVSSWFKDEAAPAVEVFAGAMKQARADEDSFRQSLQDAKNPLKDFTEAIDKTKNAIYNADTAWQTLTGRLDTKVALNNAKTALDELEKAAAKAFATGSDSDIAKYDAAAAEVASLIAIIAGTLGEISSKEIYLRFRTEGPPAALNLANWLASGAEYANLNASQMIGQAGLSFAIPGRANGGPVSAGGTYLVGE
ncbi:MAG: hypothetical protein ACO3IT_09385, partial [Ilumatobacteraceae bacterium]